MRPRALPSLTLAFSLSAAALLPLLPLLPWLPLPSALAPAALAQPAQANRWLPVLDAKHAGVEAAILRRVDPTDTRANPDKTTFYRTHLALQINGTLYELPAPVYQGDTLTLAAEIDPATHTARVFANSKDPDPAHWGMDGFLFTLDASGRWSTQQVFTGDNSGWFPFFSPTTPGLIHHFSYAGYFDKQLTLSASGTWTNEKLKPLKPEEAQARAATQKALLIR